MTNDKNATKENQFIGASTKVVGIGVGIKGATGYCGGRQNNFDTNFILFFILITFTL